MLGASAPILAEIGKLRIRVGRIGAMFGRSLDDTGSLLAEIKPKLADIGSNFVVSKECRSIPGQV